jgi:hypothetical protein
MRTDKLDEYGGVIFVCDDCGGRPGPMLLDHVWEQIGGRIGDHDLCIHCMDKRLGRPVTTADLNRSMFNIGWHEALATEEADKQ